LRRPVLALVAALLLTFALCSHVAFGEPVRLPTAAAFPAWAGRSLPQRGGHHYLHGVAARPRNVEDLATGMFTVLKYENADTKFWKPDKTRSELENPLQLNNANAFWKEMTAGLFASANP